MKSIEIKTEPLTNSLEPLINSSEPLTNSNKDKLTDRDNCPFWWNCDGQCDEMPQIEMETE